MKIFTLQHILLLKFLISFPYYLSGLYDPILLNSHNWLLYIESFHHYQARIFYLLALYRNVTQLYFAIWGFGVIQRKFVCIEAMFDINVILLLFHEYFVRHVSLHLEFVGIHICYVIASCFALYSTRNTPKHDHIV